jgi:hypothetical protein
VSQSEIVDQRGGVTDGTATITITISIVCSPEQLADVQARVSALQADLCRLGVGFSVTTHQDPPSGPPMTLQEAQRDPRAFLAGFVETERSVHFDPELARRQRELLEEHDA